MVSRDQLWGEDLIRGFPRVIRIGVPFPLDQVLKPSIPPVATVIHYRFYFEFFLPFDQIRGWPRVVSPVLTRFTIRGQQTCMEYVMDGPGRGKERVCKRRVIFVP